MKKYIIGMLTVICVAIVAAVMVGSLEAKTPKAHEWSGRSDIEIAEAVVDAECTQMFWYDEDYVLVPSSTEHEGPYESYQWFDVQIDGQTVDEFGICMELADSFY